MPIVAVGELLSGEQHAWGLSFCLMVMQQLICCVLVAVCRDPYGHAWSDMAAVCCQLAGCMLKI
jgi:hypothetical protein